MATIVSRDDLPAPTRDDVILDAYDQYLGVWINGADEEDCLWLLTRAALPCFVIHALPERESLHPRLLDSFVKNTDVARILDHETYEFDRLALREYRYTITELQPVPYAAVRRVAEDNRQSSLRWQLGLAEHVDVPLDLRAGNDELERRRQARTRIASGSGSLSLSPSEGLRVLPVPVHPDAAASSAEVQLDSTRVAWLRPPAIKGNDRRAWMTFRESRRDDNDEIYMRQLGQHSDARKLDEGDDEWYDRELQRKLIFEGTPDLGANVGLTTGRAFGRPVPDWPFLFPSGNSYLKKTRSKWMYKDQDPVASDIGRIADPPRIEQLPLLSSGAHEPHEGDWAWDANEERDDTVSLGASDGESSRMPIAPPILPQRPRTEEPRAPPRPGYVPRPVPRGLSMRNPPRPTTVWPATSAPSATPLAPSSSRSPAEAQPVVVGQDRFRVGSVNRRLTPSSSTMPLRPTEAASPTFSTFLGPEIFHRATPSIPRPPIHNTVPGSISVPVEKEVTTWEEDAFEIPFSPSARKVFHPSAAFYLASSILPPFAQFPFTTRVSLSSTLSNPTTLAPSPLLFPTKASLGATDAEPVLNSEDVEMTDVSVFGRFGVRLEERVGVAKPHRFRKHNRTQKRLRKEVERAKEREDRLPLPREEELHRERVRERLRALEVEREERRAAESRALEEERALQTAIGLDARMHPRDAPVVRDTLPYTEEDYRAQDEDLYG
ncbi:hypothetical protein K438DRAFT_1979431 [Mycena galopus ATCC 62051]|nr:hypothetical protein K438DRAFT_1979431 [Mycena galopus ATCC 62051]